MTSRIGSTSRSVVDVGRVDVPQVQPATVPQRRRDRRGDLGCGVDRRAGRPRRRPRLPWPRVSLASADRRTAARSRVQRVAERGVDRAQGGDERDRLAGTEPQRPRHPARLREPDDTLLVGGRVEVDEVVRVVARRAGDPERVDVVHHLPGAHAELRRDRLHRDALVAVQVRDHPEQPQEPVARALSHRCRTSWSSVAAVRSRCRTDCRRPAGASTTTASP